MKTVHLIPHANTLETAIEQLSCDIHCLEQGDLQLRYVLKAPLSQLAVPEQQTPNACDNLWQHTCFEAFIAQKGQSAYYEFNFSPSSQWAAYAFSDYRKPSNWQALPPQLNIEQSSHQLTLTATIKSANLPCSILELQIGITAVIENCDGVTSYWALTHPTKSPDFHHRAGLILSMD